MSSIYTTGTDINKMTQTLQLELSNMQGCLIFNEHEFKVSKTEVFEITWGFTKLNAASKLGLIFPYFFLQYIDIVT